MDHPYLIIHGSLKAVRATFFSSMTTEDPSAGLMPTKSRGAELRATKKKRNLRGFADICALCQDDIEE